ncbi:uncharacterized protein LOC106879273 [Octopus bimaculoides]|uniref:uncharacterized protein LOC106879273 n=1 Tax=Octopus bimaculoides TaxID=37653 RepID=UPI00071CA85D|nr:uncharacterized protein LOC106879273 [Octopus bimaculoides]|eukprot:XP_014784255.1 PREDICTED: uncharacterized protein LOC106879273 [Octopus bimaculoides]
MQETWCKGDDINDDYNSLIGKLKECLRKANGVCLREKKGRVSEETTKLLEKRKNMRRTIEDHLEYSLLSRVIHQQLKRDFEAYRMEKLLKAAEEKKSLKRDMALYRSEVTTMNNTDGVPVNDKSEMEENVPPILVSEAERTIGSMKNGKAPGKDGIT